MSRTHGLTHARTDGHWTHYIASPWAPVGAKKDSHEISPGFNYAWEQKGLSNVKKFKFYSISPTASSAKFVAEINEVKLPKSEHIKYVETSLMKWIHIVHTLLVNHPQFINIS